MATIGTWTLVLSVAVAAYGALAALIGVRRRSQRLTESAEKAVWTVAGLATAGCAILLYGLLAHQFQIQYVYEHSSTSLPLLYRISALWAGEEGSLLLWYWFVGVLSFAAIARRDERDPLRGYLVAVLATVQGFFALILLLTSNPFAALPLAAAEGTGLNPLLQNVGMILHPPVLFLGYAAYTIPFALSFAALAAGRTTDWIVRMRRWSLFSWATLGAGILIGGWWAYVELGWGGFWAWDPVENASLIPWLVGTALLHSTIAEERRRLFRRWNLVLPSLVFSLCLFATLVTRGGVIVSELHGFASNVQPIAYYLFAAIGIALVSTVALVIRRRGSLAEDAAGAGIVSRETSFYTANVLLCGAGAVVLLGTVYPSLVQAIRGVSVSLGASFFNRAAGPLMLLAVFLIGICPVLAWGRATRATAARLVLSGIVALVAVLILAFLRIRDPFSLVSAFVCAFVIASLVGVVAKDMAACCRKAERFSRWPGAIAAQLRRGRRRYGAHLVHLAMVLILIGITGSTAYKSERLVSLTPGESTQFHGYELTYEGFGVETLDDQPVTNQSRIRYEAALTATRNGSFVTVLRPEKNYHWAMQSPWVTEVAISSNLLEDLYVVLANLDEDGRAGFELILNPLVSWLWIGGALLLAGALLAGWKARSGRAERSRDA
jgi:cytochrome c-type biogenesis protein CcmF